MFLTQAAHATYVNCDGDVNLDGKTTAYDARLVLCYSASLIELNEEQLSHCDFSGNHVFNARVARMVLRLSAKLPIVETTTKQSVTTTPSIDFSRKYCNTELESMLNLLPITSTEKYQLCNVLGREYGGDTISIPEKAKVIAVIMNRVHSTDYGFRNANTIDAVLSQSGQFGGNHGGVSMYSYSSQVTSSVKLAVLYYFHVAQYDPSYRNYMFYYGDGYRNYFRSTY